ncbi:hypothetical protein [Streptomyces sp. NPDC001678]|uniref:DUF4190 domain-containing protein n=1 Tax=Streptomyces sp. NPDC001678 TaxID=3364599 RepID=UPI0036BA7215
MSEKDDAHAQQEHRDGDPWAPPERRVPLDKPGTAPVPPPAGPVPGPSASSESAPGPSAPGLSVDGPAAGLPAAPPAPGPAAGLPVEPSAPPAAPSAPVAPEPGAVPPVPLAPTGPGTPGAYPPGPYGYAQAGLPPQPGAPYGVPGAAGPYAQGPYAQGPYGQTAYGTGHYGWGAPGYGQGWPHAARVPNNGLGVASLVLGVIGVLMCWTIVFGVVIGVMAIVFGAIGRTKANTGEATNGGQALVGLILGGVALLLTAVMLVVFIAVGVRESTGPAGDDNPDDATYGAYMAVPPGPGPLLPAASR